MGSAVGVILCLLVFTVPAAGQTPAEDMRPAALHVFLDCESNCDEDYLRSEIDVIDYVRDRTNADVHVLVTTQPTGGGGEHFDVTFIGLRRFAGVEHTLSYVAPKASTDDERRRGLAEVFKRGLVRYLADTAMADRISIEFAPADAVGTTGELGDPWNLWVFSMNVGGSLSGERSNRGGSISGNGTANRTSEAWKIGFAINGSYQENTFELSDTQTFTAVSRNVNANALVVKSLSMHWSAGVIGKAATSTFLNYDLRTRSAAGIEYNVFPYSESTRRLLTVQYTAGFNTINYREETIFEKTSERLLDHQIATTFSMRQPWGSSVAEVSLSQFLNSPDKYNIGAFGNGNFRLFKGVFFTAFASVDRTRDQIFLPKAGATTEEILVRQRQLATSYRYSMTFGITYSFGSIFNNVVNPRFGRGGGGFDAF